MNIVRLALIISAFAGVGGLAACNDDDSANRSSSSGSSGSSSSSGSSEGDGSSGSSRSSDSPATECKLEQGIYAAHYTTRAGGTGAGGGPCSDLPDQEVEYPPSTDGGAGEGCTQDEDPTPCGFKTTCTQTDLSGYTTTIETALTANGAVEGTLHIKTVKDTDKSVIQDCSHDTTWTKK